MIASTRNSLSTFINALAQPTRFLDWLDYNIPIKEGSSSLGTRSFWKESLLWAWAFRCLGALLELGVLSLFIKYLSQSNLEFSSFDYFVSQTGYFNVYTWTFIFLGLSLLYFPILLAFQNLMNVLAIKIVLGLIDGRKTSQLNLWDSIGLSNTSYFYHLVPFLGSFAQRISVFVLLFTTLRWKFKWSRAKCALVLVAPSILFSILLMLIIFAFLIF